jgi:hypothetical protein
MFHTKDHKTLNIFDPFAYLGEKRRKLLDVSWASLFREDILPNLPVSLLTEHYDSFRGRPTKELYAMLGAVILQEMHDLTDIETVAQFSFNIQWHYALNITSIDDASCYVCEKSIWTMRKIITENNLFLPIFETLTDELIKLFDVDTGKQRIDSMHIFSNMRHLGRISLFTETIKKFLRNLKRQHLQLFNSLDKEIIERYLTKKGLSLFAAVKPSESTKTLQNVGDDLYYLIQRFAPDGIVSDMTTFKLMERLFKEQCIVGTDELTDEKVVSVKPNKDVPSDSLQSPTDPEAGYSGHKGKGYQVQVMETYDTAEEDKQLSLITYVNVEPANESDANALIPALESTIQRGVAPEEVLADTLYGSDKNYLLAEELGIHVIAPTMGSKKKGDIIPISKFTSNEKGVILSCPMGHPPNKINNKKGRHTAAFDLETCSSCPYVDECPTKIGKNASYLRYAEKELRIDQRRAKEDTEEFTEEYRFRAGVEATMSEYDRKTNVKHSTVRGIKNISFKAILKAIGINIYRASTFKNRQMEAEC